MEMEIVDEVPAHTVEVEDFILFDGSVCEIASIEEDDEAGLITFYSTDDRERVEFWSDKVEVYGYTIVEV
jgi:hypothetical protein